MSDAPDFQKTVVLNSTPSFMMPTADSPDWQETVQLVNSPQSDCPDWQQYIVGPGGTPISPTPVRKTVSVVDTWGNSGLYGITLPVSPVNVGDLMLLGFSTDGGSLGAVSGGGVTTWNRLNYTQMKGVPNVTTEQWAGIVTLTGASSISITVAGPPTYTQIMASELTASPSPTWTCYGNAGGGYYYNGTRYAWSTPSLTPDPTGSDEVYWTFVMTGFPNLTLANGSITLTGVVYGGGLYANQQAVGYGDAVNGISDYFQAGMLGVNASMYNAVSTLIYAV
jgi:hypothetical protein